MANMILLRQRSNHASEFNESTIIFIFKVRDIYLTYKRPRSHLPPIVGPHSDSSVNYVHTVIKKGSRKRDITTDYDGHS